MVVITLMALFNVINLLVTIGIRRRLKHLDNPTAGKTEFSPPPGAGRALLGAEVKTFATRTVEGRSITHADLREGTVVGFFVPGCDPCEKNLPRFVDLARSLRRKRESILAVVIDDAIDPAPMLQELGDVGHVVLDPLEGELLSAFSTSTFPTYYRLSRKGRRLSIAEIAYAPDHGLMGV
ncbi:TlpA disulfide reductase family protein [Streptosporangium sp. NPDC003464]